MIGQKGIPAIYGGVERHVHEIAVRLVRCGLKNKECGEDCEVIVYTRKWYSSDIKELEGVKIKQIWSLHTKHLDTITHSLFSTLDAIKNRADVIHYHGVGPSLISWLPKILSPKTKVITTFHSIDRKHEKWGGFAKFFLKLGEWTACKFADQTIAVSKTIAQYCRDVYDTNALYIPNGYSNFNSWGQDNLLNEWNIKPQQYILMLSRLIPHKGAHYLIEAFNNLQKNKPELMNEIKLVIVGDGYYTEKYVEKLKEQSKNNANIVFTGFQTGKSLGQLIGNAKFMVHPSDNEGTPLTVLEGMGYKLPVLLSDIPEHLELVNDPEFLFNHGSVNSLEKKILNILEMSEEKLKGVGDANQTFVDKEYNWDTITDSLITLYKEKKTKSLLICSPLSAREG